MSPAAAKWLPSIEIACDVGGGVDDEDPGVKSDPRAATSEVAPAAVLSRRRPPEADAVAVTPENSGERPESGQRVRSLRARGRCYEQRSISCGRIV